MKVKITNKGLYWGLIATFTLLYLLVAFVSTLHAIDFFSLSNIGALAILLGVAYEVGQASVLFSILMTKNKERFLPWLLMILLTALQVTANVYASFKHMAIDGGTDWQYWYTSILKIFGVTGGTTETYQVIISWISGALLPIVALGMTALVAQNIKLMTEGDEVEDGEEKIDASDLVAEISRVRPTEDVLEEAEAVLSRKRHKEEKDPEGYYEKELDLQTDQKKEETEREIRRIRDLIKKDPVESGMISDILKSKLAPGVKKDEDESEPDGEDDGTSKDPLPELSNEDVKQFEEQDDTSFPEEEMKELLDLQDQLGLVDVVLDENPQFGDENIPKIEKVEEELPTAIYEGPIKEDHKPEGGIKSNNGLVELNIPEPSTEPPKETEEERLERLRKIARENLKKK